jgi:hypothetical protein
MVGDFMKLSQRLAVALLFACLASATGIGAFGPMAAVAKPMQAPGTRVVMDLPEGFKPASRFLGFEHQSGASIVLLELPGHAFRQMQAALTAKMLASRGIVDVEPLALGENDPRVALTGRQGTQIGWFHKVMLLIGDPKTTALVTANIPEAAIESGAISRDAVITAVKSTSLAGAAVARKQRYQIADPAPLKFAGTFAGDALLFNQNGTLPRERTTDALTTFVVAGSLDTRPVTGDREAIAMRLLQSLRDLDRLTVPQTGPITIDGLDGIAQTARADYVTEGREPQPIVIYHVVLFEPEGGYVRMIGQAPLAEGRTALADFKRIAASFRRSK